MKNLSLFLIFLQVAQAPLAVTAEANTVVNTLNTATAGLNLVGQGVGAIQNSQMQMQSIVNQMSGLNGQMQGQAQQLSAFQQIGTKIEEARVAAGSCIANAAPKTSQYAKATIPAKDLEQTTISCSNYGSVIDSIRKNEAELRSVHTKMACIYDFQNKVNDLANSSKVIFTQLNQAAMKVWNTHDSVIKAQDNIVKKIDAELNGKSDGKVVDESGGYRGRLQKLRETESKIRNALNAGNTGEKGAQSGVLAQLRGIKQQRNATASSWYFNLMGETEACFANSPMPCDNLGNLATTRQCLSAYLGQGQSGGPASKVVSNVNNQRLGTAFDTIREAIRTTDMVLENVDIKNPNEFLVHANKRYNNKMQAITKSISRMKTIGNVNTGALASLARKNYEACYKEKLAEFKGDVESASGGKYRQGINAMIEQEAALSNEIKNLAEEAQREMTSFKTAFSKTYNRDLPQFTANCTKENDPYSSADCLKKVQLMLKAGLDGTMEGGQNQSSFVPEPTTMNLQSISNQNGNITVTSKAMTCVGFEECLVTMENYMAGHQGQKDAQVLEREQFVKKHNEEIAAAMATTAQAFGSASDIFTNSASSINAELTEAGVLGAEVKVKSIENPEPLAPNADMEDPKLTGVPKDMKAAFAAAGKYNEIDGDKVTQPLQKRKEKLAELTKDAAKMKGKCKIDKSDFNEVADQLRCDSKNVCRDSNFRAGYGALEKLLKKSSSSGLDKEANDELASNTFANCMKDARKMGVMTNSDINAVNFDLGDETETEGAAASEGKPTRYPRTATVDRETYNKKQTEKNKESKLEQEDCKFRLMQSLGNIEPRGSMKDTVSPVKAAINGMANACTNTSEDSEKISEEDKEEASEACQKVKSLLKRAKAPDEGESPDTAAAPSNSTTPNPMGKSGF